MASNIKKNTIYNMINTVAKIIFPLITFPYSSRVLHAAKIGTVNYANSVYSYIALISTLSITSYAVRESSVVKNDREKLGHLASEIFSINVWSTLIAYLVMIVVCLIPSFHNIVSLILINSINMILVTLGADWLNTAMEDFRYITIRSVAFQFLSLILMFAFVHQPSDYVKYVVISVIASSGSEVMNMFYRRKYCELRFILHPNLKKHLPPIMKMFAAVITQQFYVNSDTVMLGLMTTSTAVGLYSTATKVFNIVNTLMSSIFTVVLAQATIAYTHKHYDRYNSLLRKVIMFLVSLGLPIVVGMMVISKNIIVFISGPEYAAAAGTLSILAVSLFFAIIHGFLGWLVAMPMGDYDISLKAAFWSSLVNIGLNLVLIPRIGYPAAAVTTTIAELISAIIIATRWNHNIKIRNISKTVFHSILGCILMSVFLIFMKQVQMGVMLQTVLMIGGGAVIYGLTLLATRDEFVREAIKFVLRRE